VAREGIPTGRARRAAGATTALAPGALRLLGGIAARVGRSPERSEELLVRHQEQLADAAVEVLGSLRGGAMKIGQLASFLDVDLLPPEHRAIWQERLAVLQDAAPPMPWRRVERVLAAEWGRPVGDVLADVERDTAAGASIGQVHRAVLKDGREVALKVQYPEIADALRADVDTAAVLIRLGKVIAPGLDPKLVARELRERILEEVDYELEATNQHQFARAWRGHPHVLVPAVVTELSRRRVLVSDWVPGRRFEEVVALPQAERDRYGELVYRFAYGSMHRVGAYNTDLHPGNHRLGTDGRVAFLDFGSIKHVGRDRMVHGVRGLLAVEAGDVEALRTHLGALGYLRDAPTASMQRWMEQVRRSQPWLFTDAPVTIDADLAARVMGELVAPDGAATLVREMAVPADEIMFRRLELGVVAVLARLRATANWRIIAHEHWFGTDPVSDVGRADAAFWHERGRDAPLLT
jgi:predicted unusual protein kinase regulating ubiquinone biosynthesis (AarF/ABC1/UbiB family)